MAWDPSPHPRHGTVYGTPTSLSGSESVSGTGICESPWLEKRCAGGTGSGQLLLTPHSPYTGCLCKAPRADFPCRHHLEMWDFSAAEGLERSQCFNKSCFPSSPPTDCTKAVHEVRPASPTMAKETCWSYSPNPRGDEPPLSWTRGSTCCQEPVVCLQPLHTCSVEASRLLLPELPALGGWAAHRARCSLHQP